MRRPTADSRKMKYLKAALAALALRRALQLPSCVADQLASDLINLNRIQAVPNISSPQARSGASPQFAAVRVICNFALDLFCLQQVGRLTHAKQPAVAACFEAVTPGGLDPGADGAAARTATTPSSDSQRQISAHIFGDSAKISTARDPAFSGKENDEARNIERASLPAKPSNAEDDALVASIEAAVAESHVAALQDPALHCSSPEKEYTHFCRTLREFAAAALVSQELEDVECIFGTLKERKRARKEMDRARTVAAKQGMEQKLSTGAKKEKKRDSFSVGFGKSKKSAKQTQPTTLPSMVQLPPVDTQAYRNEVHAREYSANVAAARKKARGSAGGKRTPSVVDSSRKQLMLLAGMAKQLLHELLQIASLAPEGASISLDIGEVEGVLRSILVQGTSYAQPLAPYCAFIIQKALSDISTKALTPEDARAAALVALTSFDNLACDAAKQKAAATAEHLGARSREINERVRALAKRHEYAGLPSGIGMQIVDIVLSVLESIEQMTPVSLQPSPAEGALGFQGTSAPTAPISMPTGGRPVDITYVAVPGLTGSAVGLTSLQFFQDVGEEPKYRARFHDVLTDYTLRNVGTPQNVCITDTMVFPTGGLSFREGAGPTQSLGALATSAVERWALRRAHEAVQPAVTLFRDDETIKEYAAQLLKRHISSLKEATSPAPSFNGLTSSGCTSYSDDARRLFYEHFYSNQLFSMVKQNVKTNSKLQLRAQLLQTQGEMLLRLEMRRCLWLFTRLVHVKPIFPLTCGFPPASKYGFLDVCDTKCYTREKSRRSDVLASAIYTLDHTLAKLNSMAYRALTISGSFFGDLNLNPQNSEASKHVKARTALSTMLSLWTAKQQKGEKKGRLPEGIATAMEDYSIALECYANMMSQSPETRNVYNLAAHTWVQLRGIHNAAEGFIPGKGSKISERNKQVAAVFSKLWFEADPAFVQTPGSLLKPFPGLMASVALQVAFFLHSVVGEYNAGLWKQMGVAVKSFFVGLFRRNKRMKVPNSWKQVEARAYPGPRTDVKGFQGALHTISQLAKTFHERFLEQAMAVHDSSTLLPPYIAFIHGLVAQWMNPYGGKFSINDPHISKAKKLFYYSVFIHPKGLTYVASELIRAGCKGLGKIDVGEVRATVEHSGKRQAVGATILRQKPVSIKGSALEYHLNMLLATYEDPFDLIRVAQDLATRCQAGAGLAGSTSFLEQDAGAEGSEKKKRFGFPSVGCKKQKIHDPNQERLVQIMSSKFVLDTWCLKYKDFVAKTLTEVPKTTNTQELSLLLEEALDKITEVVLTSATCDTFWVLNLKCPFMRDFIDAEMRLKTRRAMLHYAISRRGIGKRLRRKLRAIKNWFTKKFTWKRRRKPGLRADNEWAVIHAGTSTWDPQKKRFEHTLTFRPESMACSSQQEPTKLIDFQDGKFAIGNLGADTTVNDAVLCVKDDVYCWATRRALMFKGSTEAPIAHTEQPAGLWYSRLSGVSGPSTKGSRS
ncbi:hypothetical protein Esti_006527 [Eimeria stiedai]